MGEANRRHSYRQQHHPADVARMMANRALIPPGCTPPAPTSCDSEAGAQRRALKNDAGLIRVVSVVEWSSPALRQEFSQRVAELVPQGHLGAFDGDGRP